jgi:hypothetical protein
MVHCIEPPGGVVWAENARGLTLLQKSALFQVVLVNSGGHLW